DEPALLLLHGREEREGGRRQLEVRRLSTDRAQSRRMEANRNDAAGRYGDGIRLACAGRVQLGAFANGDLRQERQEAGVGPTGRQWRRRQHAAGRASVAERTMKTLLCGSAVACLLFSAPALAQPVPRTPDGKPDLSGVWQPGSDRPGTWAEANQGVGV